MKEEELQIGDWVLCDRNAQSEYEFDTVDYQLYQIKDGEDIDYACEKNISGDNDVYLPIPLTVEILEKNGFEMADDTYTRPTVFYFSKDRRVQVSNLTNSGDGYWCVHVDNEDFETIGSCDVKYVHEMQNLLRLCKYELDFKI